MKSNAPWSVKGIERDARETAKEAAKREGMTVGEWLNQMIYTAGDPEASGGEVEGLKLRDVVTAIDHLHKRIADSSAEHGSTVGELTSKMGDVVERVQRLERNKPGGGDRERVEALKALEKAVTQVAVQFSDAQQTTLARLDASEKGIEKLSAQIAAGGEGAGDAGLSAAIEDLKTRVSRAEDLASGSVEGQGGDPAFIESTSNRLRVLGDEIKRGGDQISALEATIGKLSQQIEAAERRSAEGVQKTAETLADLREKFTGDSHDGVNRDDIAAVVADQTRDTVERVEHLQASLEKMLSRLDGLDDGTPATRGLEGDLADTDAEQAGYDADATEPHAGTHDPMPLGDVGELKGEAPSSERAPDKNTSDDEDDDFFSFADDIDASIEESATSERDDDFSFELDEGSEQNAEGASILSEVQNVFSGEAPAETETEPEQPESQDSIDAELDELLAGLDDVAEEEPHTEDLLPEAPPPAAEATPASDDNAPGKEDLLESIRQKAREDAANRAAGGEATRLTRRKLTPKQKAILAARARRKRLAEEAEKGGVHTEDAEEAAAKQQAIKNVFAASAASDDADDDASPSGSQGGLFAKIRSNLPFIGGQKRAEEEEDAAPTPDPEFNDDGDQEALDTLTKTASARPVTLALGVGIFLALGLLFFLVRDLIFTPRGNDAVSPVAETAEPAATVAAEPTLEAPAPPAIDPSTLYRDAMTGLNAAGNEAETAIAIEKLEQAAMLGHPPAQLQLGELYKTGQGVDQDLTQARVWFRRAANGGNVLAMHRVGVMTARGEGGAANTPEAIGWFEQAANRGLVDSQYNLGAIYHPSGEAEAQPGNIQDAGKAYYWYSLAAQNGDEQATPLAAGVGASLNESQRAEIDEAIMAWEAIPSDVEANTLAATG